MHLRKLRARANLPLFPISHDGDTKTERILSSNRFYRRRWICLSFERYGVRILISSKLLLRFISNLFPRFGTARNYCLVSRIFEFPASFSGEVNRLTSRVIVVNVISFAFYTDC